MKKPLTFLAVFLFLLAFALPSWAAISVVNNNGCLAVTLDGTNSFDWNTAIVTSGTGSGSSVKSLFPTGLQITKMVGSGAAGANIKIRDGSTTGPFIPPGFGNVSGDKMVMYFTDGRWYKPCMVQGDMTSSTNYTVGFYYFND